MTYHFSGADRDLKSKVWWKGTPIDGHDSKVWMRDKCGTVMKWAEHGDRTAEHGWEIDHIYPVSLGGSDEIDNLQPLHWKNNAAKADTYPWNC